MEKTREELLQEIAQAKPLVRTHYNNHLFPRHYEYNFEPSQTIPDQSLSVKEILDRYRKGLPLTGRQPVYLGDEDDFTDLEKMDLVDRQNVLEQARESIERFETAKERARMEKEARDRKELEDFRNAKRDAENEKPQPKKPEA